MSLLLAGVALSLSLTAPAVVVEPGSELAGALALTVEADARYAVDGAPPGPRGLIPRAPSKQGPHFLVVYADDGRPSQWLRFEVGNAPGEPVDLVLAVDRRPPALQVHAEGTVVRDGVHYAGALSRLSPQGSDASGLAGDLRLLLDGVVVEDPARMPWPDFDRAVVVHARGSDALGNAGRSAPLALTLDRRAPTLHAERASPRAGVEADIVAPGERVRLGVQDDGSGLSRLQLGDLDLPLDGVAQHALSLQLPGRGDYRLTDRLGNSALGTLPLRVDAAPPRLMLISDGTAQEASDGARLPRSERLELQAEDAPAGVARACVELSIWYGDCRALPLSLVGIDPGRYRLLFRASDRLGHTAYQRMEIEVLP